MKKFISLMLSSLLLFSLVACEKNQDESITSEKDVSIESTTEESSSIVDKNSNGTETITSSVEILENNDFLEEYSEIIDNSQDVIFEHENETVAFKIPEEYNYYFVSRNFPESNYVSIGIINENHDSIMSITKDKSIDFTNSDEYNVSRTNINDKMYTLYQAKGYLESIIIVPDTDPHYTIGYNSSEFSDYEKQVLYNILASLEI